MSQLHLRITIPDRGPGVKVAATCDYCGKLARVRVIGNDLVCDRCMGTVEAKPNDKVIGWTEGDGSGHEGYRVEDYFRDGRYLGPDAHGIEPIFTSPADGETELEQCRR